ncbi:MAG TPA: glutamate decarboxylase [Candidatus Poseidoniaceae archaeon]|nr:MAG TPA: glutamate decarboxylase [Candidatus Poseidoniales archaeon]HII31509.1 glutamate decarboxylase [Candidatus Poseidoniaceae archaeon]|tara:strand:- start:502 stop:1917 length:1416 start_codon:yes stop_codon:yes gene_type:complete
MEAEQFLDDVLARVKDFLAASQTESSIRFAESSQSLGKTTDLKLPLEGRGLEAALDDIETVLRHSVRTTAPGFMNPLWGGLSIASIAGELVTAATNTAMYTYEIAPIATLIESTILKRMADLADFGTSQGTLTTGGSNGNLLGMLCARQAKIPLSSHSGFDGTKMVAFVSEECHYSFRIASNVIGIGHSNLIKVRCNEDGQMLPEALDEEIQRAQANDQIPFAVLATSGTTVRGSFDPLREIAGVAHKHNLWLHVDAAWGGSCLFSSRYRSLMDGIELADSFCWDAHKMMGIPLICSAFIVKDADILRAVCSTGQTAHYLYHDTGAEVDLGRYSLQCGRRNDALKLWLAWREIGDAGWASMLERFMDLADFLQQRIEKHDALEMVSDRMWTNVCFRYVGESSEGELNRINAELRERLVHDGRFMVSRSTVDQKIILRSVIANRNITESSLDAFLDRVVSIGKDIERGLPQR